MRKPRRDQGQAEERPTRLVDHQVGKLVKERDGWRCRRCGGDFSENRNQLTCSHFVNVRYSSCRFYMDNCIALCVDCHTGPKGWEFEKGGGRGYRTFMMRWLGKVRYQRLMERKKAQMDLASAKNEFFERLRKGRL